MENIHSKILTGKKNYLEKRNKVHYYQVQKPKLMKGFSFHHVVIAASVNIEIPLAT